MPKGGSELAASLRKQNAAPFSEQRFTSPASACPSFRIYYYDGAAGSVPFEWESHPGTPKHPSSELPPLPPLTPPPSHFSFASSNQIRRGSKKPSKKILALIVTKLFWLSNDQNNINVKKLSASSPSVSERVLIGDNEYDLFKFQTNRRFSSFDSSATSSMDYPIRRSQSTSSCFGIHRCFLS